MWVYFCKMKLSEEGLTGSFPDMVGRKEVEPCYQKVLKTRQRCGRLNTMMPCKQRILSNSQSCWRQL